MWLPTYNYFSYSLSYQFFLVQDLSKTKLTATTDGFDFLGWNFRVQKNGKFRSRPSEDNYKTFRKKIKTIINSSNYGAIVKAEKLAPIVRGWRNYHRYCNMEGARNSLWFINNNAFRVFNKEKKQDKQSSRKLIETAFRSQNFLWHNFYKLQSKIFSFGDLSIIRAENYAKNCTN